MVILNQVKELQVLKVLMVVAKVSRPTAFMDKKLKLKNTRIFIQSYPKCPKLNPQIILVNGAVTKDFRKEKYSSIANLLSPITSGKSLRKVPAQAPIKIKRQKKRSPKVLQANGSVTKTIRNKK